MSTPLIVMSIELKQGQYAQLSIFKNSDPQKLAEEFIVRNALPPHFLQPIKQNIIKQMCVYDAINHIEPLKEKEKEKENKSPVSKRIYDTEKKQVQPSTSYASLRTPERPSKSAVKRSANDTESENDTYSRLYRQYKDINNKKQVRQEEEKKRKEMVQMSDPNLTFKPVINKKSTKMVSNLRQPKLSPSPMKKNIQSSPHLRGPVTPTKNGVKPSPRQFAAKSPRLDILCQKMKPEVKISILENGSFSSNQQSIQEKTRPPLFPCYTEDQIENSFSDFIKKEQSSTQGKVILNLFKILDYNELGYIDPRQVPYERLSSQMIVKIRGALKEYTQPINYNQFEQMIIKNHALMQTATEFFGFK